MVALTDIQAANSNIKSSYPSGLVAVFVGATAGIGLTALREFARQTHQPRIYFVGRTQEAGDKIVSELKVLNPKGQYTFLRADTSLLRNVDDVCRQIKEMEKTVNVVCLTQGTLKVGTSTEEGLHYIVALGYYARMRFIVNLLPLIQAAPGLRRVLNVSAGTKEGKVFPDDWQGYKIPMTSARGHMASMMTLAHLALARQAPDVSFIHDYPGYVKTGIIKGDEGLMLRVAAATVLPLLAATGLMPVVSHEECGQRHAYYCTSGRYPAKEGLVEVKNGGGVAMAIGVDGKLGSGVYTVDEKGESAGQKVVDVVNKLVEDGMVDALWKHTISEFVRITGTEAV